MKTALVHDWESGRGDSKWAKKCSVCVCVCPSQDFRSHLIALHANETSQTCTQGQGSAQLSTVREATLWRLFMVSEKKENACVFLWVYWNSEKVPVCLRVRRTDCCYHHFSCHWRLFCFSTAALNATLFLPRHENTCRFRLHCLPTETHTHTRKHTPEESSYSLLGSSRGFHLPFKSPLLLRPV